MPPAVTRSRHGPWLAPLLCGILGTSVTLALAGCATAPPQTGRNEHLLTPEEKKQVQFHTNPNLFTRSNTMKPAPAPMSLPAAKAPPSFTWRHEGKTYNMEDYFQRQPVMAVLIAKDGEVVFERYQFGRTAQHRYLSNSMAKSLTGLAFGFAHAEGKLPSFDALSQSYVPELKGTAYGETSVRNLLRMGSGVKYSETYKPGDDWSKFREALRRLGTVQASRQFTDREAPQGSRFNYASIETALAGAVLKAATGEGIANYLQPRLWQAIGAEGEAKWQVDVAGLEQAQCCILALPRDYLRLGIVLANDGKRPDTGQQVIPIDYLLDSTDWHRLEAAFRPKNKTSYFGYSNYFWLENSQSRRFMLLGIHGQAIFVDPANKLVMVHLAASEAAKVGETTMGNERAALWRGVVQQYGRW